MPNVTRGQRMGGLLGYLAGRGRHNEHEDPHLVAGDPALMTWHGETVLDAAAAQQVARDLDHPRSVFGTEVAGGHVWHCSLSLRAAEGQLSDEKWAAIAAEFVDGMGFTDTPGSPGEGKAPCRWVAVRHGLSAAGNDHIHLVVDLVREDGTKASVWNDRPRAQQLAGELERRHGLEVLESRSAGRGARGLKPGELAKAERSGAAEPDRQRLERTVRACAAASSDEAEFVRRLRRVGVLARPRFAAGRDDVVAGFSVALRTGRDNAGASTGQSSGGTGSGSPVWFGGGHLARDLTLPRLRADWPDTPASASEAAAEWKAASRGQRPINPGREMAAPDPELWQSYTAEVAALREQLRAVPADDRGTWAQVARETAGAFAAWSVQVETAPGPLADAAAALSRTAHVRAHQVQPRPAGLPSARGAALLLSAAQGNGTVAQAALLRQLMNTARALHDAHQAAGEARRAAEIATTMRGQLRTFAAALDPAATAQTGRGTDSRDGVGGQVAVLDPTDDTQTGSAGLGTEATSEAEKARRVAQAGQMPARVGGSPVPNRIEPGQKPARATPGRRPVSGPARDTYHGTER